MWQGNISNGQAKEEVREGAEGKGKELVPCGDAVSSLMLCLSC